MRSLTRLLWWLWHESKAVAELREVHVAVEHALKNDEVLVRVGGAVVLAMISNMSHM